MNTWIHNGPPAEQQAYVEYVARHSDATAITPDGDMYFVSSRMGSKELIVPVGNTVVVSTDIHPMLRSHMARIGIWSMETPSDPHAVADACQTARALITEEVEIEATDGGENYTLIPDMISSDIGETLANILKNHKSAADRHIQKHGRDSVKPLLRQQIKYGLGRAQEERAPDNFGQILDMVRHDMWIPDPIPDGASGKRLVVPFGESGRKKHEIGIYHSIEPGDTHACATCSGHIFAASDRLTEQLPPELSDYSDHRHKHRACSLDDIVTRGDARRARTELIPPERLRFMGRQAARG